MPADSKLYLYLDPGALPRRRRLDVRSAPVRGMGAAPAHRLPVAGRAVVLAVRASSGSPTGSPTGCGSAPCCWPPGSECGGALACSGSVSCAAFVAAVVYQVSPYVLPYVSRDLGDAAPVGRAGMDRRLHDQGHAASTWGDPAAIALIVFTVGAVNATALAMIVPAPCCGSCTPSGSAHDRGARRCAVALRVVGADGSGVRSGGWRCS